MKRWAWLLVALMVAPSWHWRVSGAQAEHVVVVVWDGMRPDFVSPQYTPTLHALAARGVFFKNHHSTYVTSTEVNGAALSTGMFPDRSGIVANVQYRPDLGWLNTYGTESLEAIRRGDLLTGGHYLEAETIPEILQAAGISTITAGAKPVVLLHDRAKQKQSQAEKDSVTLFRGQTLPRSAVQQLVKIPEVGAFPSDPAADSTGAKVKKWLRTGQDQAFLWLYGETKRTPTSRLIDAWTTRALVHGFWKERVPKYTLLWLSEPDASQHQSGVGSEHAEAAMAECDRNLALVLKTLETKGLLERTDILVVSDHGFSTIDRGPEVIKSLKRAKFVAGKQFENPEAGDIMVVNLGGSIYFYVFEHDQPTIRRLIEFLQSSDFAGVIFSATPVEGTFPLSQVRLAASKGAPDVVVSMRWSDGKSDGGAPGLLTAMEGKRGRGTHASLSRFDIHNTLIAAGPDFRKGYVNELPSGNVDVPPTVLAILGVPQPSPMGGRVLAEAMVGVEVPSLKPEPQQWEASRDLGIRVWRQSLKATRVGPVLYFDEGNGESRMK
jgi:arylsulfatase A-like enzyme